MSRKDRRTGEDKSLDPEDLLPEHSVLDLEEYLAMQKAIGNETRFRILYTLKTQGQMNANQLRSSLEIPRNTLHYHLDRLCNVGLIQNRKQKTPESDDLYSYYVASAMGKVILEHGVEELMRRERDFKAIYSS